jgi:hypothetical protein
MINNLVILMLFVGNVGQIFRRFVDILVESHDPETSTPSTLTEITRFMKMNQMNDRECEYAKYYLNKEYINLNIKDDIILSLEQEYTANYS